jgi:cytochrome c oxidase cbb3-type subunit 3
MSTTDPHHEEHADGIVEDRKQAPPAYFNILFYGLIAWGVVFIAYFLLSGWSSHDEFAEKMAAHTGTPVATQAATAAPTEAEPATNGAALFAANCAGCHGAKGEGGFGPDLTADTFKYGRTADAVRESITDGRPKNMPGFNGRLTQGEIATLTAFVINL